MWISSDAHSTSSPIYQDLPVRKRGSSRPRRCWQLAADEMEGDLSIKMRLLGGKNTTSCGVFSRSRTHFAKQLPFRHPLRGCHQQLRGRLGSLATWLKGTRFTDFSCSRTDLAKRLPFRHALRRCHQQLRGRLGSLAAWLKGRCCGVFSPSRTHFAKQLPFLHPLHGCPQQLRGRLGSLEAGLKGRCYGEFMGDLFRERSGDCLMAADLDGVEDAAGAMGGAFGFGVGA